MQPQLQDMASATARPRPRTASTGSNTHLVQRQVEIKSSSIVRHADHILAIIASECRAAEAPLLSELASLRSGLAHAQRTHADICNEYDRQLITLLAQNEQLTKERDNATRVCKQMNMMLLNLAETAKRERAAQGKSVEGMTTEMLDPDGLTKIVRHVQQAGAADGVSSPTGQDLSAATEQRPQSAGASIVKSSSSPCRSPVDGINLNPEISRLKLVNKRLESEKHLNALAAGQAAGAQRKEMDTLKQHVAVLQHTVETLQQSQNPNPTAVTSASQIPTLASTLFISIVSSPNSTNADVDVRSSSR